MSETSACLWGIRALKIAGGLEEQGIVVGNAYDKYGSQNPLVRWIMQGFSTALSDYVALVQPRSIHELGCGEGFWVLEWISQGIVARGSDFSEQVIDIARMNAVARGAPPSLFSVQSIYNVQPNRDGADLIVCCEVLEHLEDPHKGLSALQRIVDRHVIISVPQEPLWRILNIVRGKYIGSLGNTPGHIQHWSPKEFVKLVGRYFEIL